MKHDHFAVQGPASPAKQLLLLFHGVGDNPVAMDHLRYTVPKHYFDEALSGGKPNDEDIVEFL